jgi:hypothetical protein
MDSRKYPILAWTKREQRNPCGQMGFFRVERAAMVGEAESHFHYAGQPGKNFLFWGLS